MQGFKAWESKPFPIRPGDRVAFSDIKMQIGEASAEVTVEATESQAVKPLDTPERSDVLTVEGSGDAGDRRSRRDGAY